MSYTKTYWRNNNTPPINASNLNKIEDELVKNDQKNADQDVAIYNIKAGAGAAIKGTKALNDIYTTAGNTNDIYIDAATGHGWISDGKGAGAAHWSDVGMLRGDKGPKGDKGEMGLGINFERAYADLAALKAANPHPALGDTHLTIDTGNLWVYDNPTPPHDIAGADWYNVGHVRGPQGPAGEPGHKGDKGDVGPQGPPGAPTHLATGTETAGGTVTDKGVTPYNLANNLPTLAADVSIKKALPKMYGWNAAGGKQWSFGSLNATSMVMENDVAKNAVTLFNNGAITLYTKNGEKAYVNSEVIVTGTLSGTTLTLTL